MHLFEIMLPATLHGVGVIAKLYFVIFAAFKESVTLNLAQVSFATAVACRALSSFHLSSVPLPLVGPKIINVRYRVVLLYCDIARFALLLHATFSSHFAYQFPHCYSQSPALAVR